MSDTYPGRNLRKNRTEPLILTIDDELSVRQSLRLFLEDNNFRVIEACDGPTGLGAFQTHHPDLILLDLRMPGMDGFQVMKEVEARDCETPVIVISGTGAINDVVKALRLGACNYLIKPIEDMSVLVHAVDSALERKRLLRENRHYQENLEKEVAQRTIDLRRSEQRYRMLVNNAGSPIVYYSASGIILTINPVAAQNMGGTPETLTGRSISEILPEYYQTFSEKVSWIREAKTGRTDEEFIVLPHGERWFISNFQPELNANGEVTTLQVVSQDITQLKSTESKLQQTLKDLEQKAEALKQMNKDMSLYTSFVSHDLKASIRDVGNLMHFWMEEISPSAHGEQLAYIHDIKQSLARAQQLIDDMLELSMMNRSERVLESVNLGELIGNLIDEMVPDSISIKMDTTWPTIFIEKTFLNQVLRNLIENAVKFNTSKAPSIELGWVDKGNDTIEVRVRDNGIGIDGHQTKRIFEAFHRLHHRDDFEGSGVGLYIAGKAAEKLGGIITVDSLPGSGSTFYFSFPVKRKI